MKTLVKVIPLVALLVACGAPTDKAIKKKIQGKKNQIARFEQQIVELEKQLTDTTHETKLVPVSVKEMSPESFNHYIIVYGKVEADKYALVSPEMGGHISKIYVREGQFVNKGELLIDLNTKAVLSQIKATKSSLDLATSTYEKQKALWNQEIGSEIQYLQAKSAKEGLEANLEALEAQLRMAQIRAPFTGTVNKIHPKIGELASPGLPVLEIVNLDKMTVRADVSESYIGRIKKGQKVDLTFSSLDDVKITTPIIRLSKVINQQNRTFEIELKIDNRAEKIKPNMVSTIRINDYRSNEAMVVPSLAIRKDIRGNFVYVVEEKEGKDVVAKKYIETSKSYNDKTTVTEGLVQNDKVIVKGFHTVSSGLPVRIVN